jgi:hypothetical protein
VGGSRSGNVVQQAPARRSVGAARTPVAPVPGPVLHPEHEAVLTAQRLAGNQAVVRAGPAAAGAIAVQRGFLDRFRKAKAPAPEKPTWEKQAANELTSDEGQNEFRRVKPKIDVYINDRNQLVAQGMSVEKANQEAFSKAPPDIRRYLPLHSEYDSTKREIDKARTEEGAKKTSQVAEGLKKHAQEHGYKVGIDSPFEAKPKDIAKELAEDQAFARQMQRRAERLIAGDIAAAEVTLETAKENGDSKGILDAQKQLDHLKGPHALQAKLFDMAMEMKVAIDEVTAQKIEEHKAMLKVDHLSAAEQWRLREKAKAKVRKDMEGGINSKLADAGKIVGTVGTVAPKVLKKGAKQAKPLTEKLTTAQQGTFKGVMGTIGAGIKSIGGIFSKAVKLASTISDKESDKLDKDANVQIAEQSLGIVKSAAGGARGLIKAVQHFNDTLGTDPGLAAAIPGVAIASGVIGFAGNVVSIQPPWERMTNTVKTEAAMTKAGNAVVATALKRSIFENKLQVQSEVVGMVANGIRVGSAIAEIATAGGMGIPRAIYLGATALEGVKSASDFMRMEMMRSATQDARKQGALQVEGSGQKLIKTDISYALDTIIMAAKKAIERKASGKFQSGDDDLIAVLESYGIPRSQAARLSMGEIHEKMLDKLGTDDEQETLKMKAQAGFEDAKKALKDLAGGDKDKGYKDLDTYAKEQQQEAEREANMTTGDKIKEGFKTAGGYAKKIITAPLKITKLGDMAKEKSEKVRRLQEIKNITNYKDRSDRGRGFRIKEFGADISESVAKLAKWIVATQPPEKAAIYLKELHTLDEMNKMTKKVREKHEEQGRSKEKTTDRVVTASLVDKGDSMSREDLAKMLGDKNLGKADREYVKYLLQKKAA